MKNLFKIVHQQNHKIRTIKLVAHSEEEAMSKALMKYGPLEKATAQIVPIEKKLSELREQKEKAMQKIEQKTATIIQFKVSLLEYRLLEQQLRKNETLSCYRIKWQNRESISSWKVLAVNPTHASTLFQQGHPGEYLKVDDITIEVLNVPYQIQEIERYLLKILKNQEKEVNKVVSFQRQMSTLEEFSKLLECD